MEFFTLFAFVAIFVSWYQIKYYRRNKLLLRIPAIKSYPLVGSNLTLFRKSAVDMLKVFEKALYELGPVFRFDHSPFASFVILADPKAIEALLTSQKLIEKSEEYKFLRNWLGDGLLLSNGRKWRQRRKLLTPAFHFKILENYVEIMESQARVFVSNLKKYEGQHVDFFPMIGLFTLDVICESAMNYKLDAQNDANAAYVKAIKRSTSIITYRGLSAFSRYDFIYRFTKWHSKEQRELKVLHDFTRKIIALRKKDLAKNTTHENFDNGFGIQEKCVFLDILLNAKIDGERLSLEEVCEEVDTFMFEGHDTTSSGISFALYNLARHPEEQQKVFEEISQIFERNTDEPWTVHKLNSLKYLEKVIKESLRLYPSVVFSGRKICDEVMLGDIIIPENTTVYFSPYFLARNSKVYTDPLKFDPSRFDVENQKSNPFQYIPFSAGMRNCIGQKFAMLEMKSIISKIIYNFKISITKENEKLNLVAPLILRPLNGFVMCANQRKKSS